MKKIITFLFCTTIVSASFAQATVRKASYRKAATKAYNTTVSINTTNYANVIEQRNEAIQEVNDQNNFRVQLVLKDNSLSIWDKRDALNELESQRIDHVNTIYQKYKNQVAYYTSSVRKSASAANFHSTDGIAGR